MWREKIFSQANAADSLAEVIKLINGSSYGLSESLSTLDFGDTENFISGVITGQVAMNLPASGLRYSPFVRQLRALRISAQGERP